MDKILTDESSVEIKIGVSFQADIVSQEKSDEYAGNDDVSQSQHGKVGGIQSVFQQILKYLIIVEAKLQNYEIGHYTYFNVYDCASYAHATIATHCKIRKAHGEGWRCPISCMTQFSMCFVLFILCLCYI